MENADLTKESPINPDLPQNIRSFLEENQREISEQDKIRQDRIRELAGDNPSESDIDSAEGLIEEEIVSSDHASARKRAQSGIITLIPRDHLGKLPMIGLETEDPKVFELFNTAAGEATRKYGGFHQVGHSGRDGYTAWELWGKKDGKSWKIIKEVFEQAKIYSRYYIPNRR